jgi:hypothetical protein
MMRNLLCVYFFLFFFQGNILYSMQKMTADSEEVRSFLDVLAVSIRRHDCVMSAQEISNALWGLQGMNSDFKEVIHIYIYRSITMLKSPLLCIINLITIYLSYFIKVRSVVSALNEKISQSLLANKARGTSLVFTPQVSKHVSTSSIQY